MNTWSKFHDVLKTDNHKAIELMLTNSVPSFQNSCAALETGLYDFDKMTVTVFKSY